MGNHVVVGSKMGFMVVLWAVRTSSWSSWSYYHMLRRDGQGSSLLRGGTCSLSYCMYVHRASGCKCYTSYLEFLNSWVMVVHPQPWNIGQYRSCSRPGLLQIVATRTRYNYLLRQSGEQVLDRQDVSGHCKHSGGNFIRTSCPLSGTDNYRYTSL